MSLEKTKGQLIQLLIQKDISVIALSGRWGTGKTHLWTEVKTESDDDKVKNSLYVSLFGLSSVDQIKRKLMEGAIPGVEENGDLFDGFKNLVRAGVKAAAEHYKGLAALNDLNVLLMAPVVLREKVVVIDDIERKHEKLGIDEVLGFIDEYSKQFAVRFVLVLNDDQLSSKPEQKRLWATFREKVIDQEIRLLTTPEEAFSIAIRKTPSGYALALERASIVCRLTNIRIVSKVIKAANLVLAGRELTDAIQARVVPSIVLFSAIHFHGIEDVPDFQFALNVANPDWSRFGRGKDAELTEQEMREDRWRMLMQELGINSCDEFEQVLVEYLESGLFEPERIQAIIDRYMDETEAMQARDAARAFLKRAFWDHRVADAELLAEAEQFQKTAALLDPYLATQLFDSLSQLRGGLDVGNSVINAWVAAAAVENHHNAEDSNPFNNPIHPTIKAFFDAASTTAHASLTVVDACMHIIEKSGWGMWQETVMKQATAADFEAAIREMDIDNLRHFMRRMIEMRLQKATYEPHFGTATQHFMDACRSIANDQRSPRLAALIQKLIAPTALASELSLPVAGSVARHQIPGEGQSE